MSIEAMTRAARAGGTEAGNAGGVARRCAMTKAIGVSPVKGRLPARHS